MTDSAREARARRRAAKHHLAIEKSRRRDWRCLDFGLYGIVDPHNNTVVAGGLPNAYSLSLAEVER